MVLNQVDRLTAVMLAHNIYYNRTLLELSGELNSSIKRLYKYKLFTIGEISEFANVSEYLIKRMVRGEEGLRARSGIYGRHLDHIVRMIDSPAFTKKHIKSLIKSGATFAALARVSGISESSLRRWEEEI